jgi:hypothetical protein
MGGGLVSVDQATIEANKMILSKTYDNVSTVFRLNERWISSSRLSKMMVSAGDLSKATFSPGDLAFAERLIL